MCDRLLQKARNLSADTGKTVSFGKRASRQAIYASLALTVESNYKEVENISLRTWLGYLPATKRINYNLLSSHQWHYTKYKGADVITTSPREPPWWVKLKLTFLNYKLIWKTTAHALGEQRCEKYGGQR